MKEALAIDDSPLDACLETVLPGVQTLIGEEEGVLGQGL